MGKAREDLSAPLPLFKVNCAEMHEMQVFNYIGINFNEVPTPSHTHPHNTLPPTQEIFLRTHLLRNN